MKKCLGFFMVSIVFLSVVISQSSVVAALGTNEVIVEFVSANNNEDVNGKVIIEGSCDTLNNEDGYQGKIGKSTNKTADNSAICTYVPRLSEGLYRIYTHKNYTATGSVKYTVHHRYSGDYPDETGGLNWGLNYTTIVTDANGDKWYPMGEYYFTGVFGDDYIRFSTKKDSYGYFDAVKFEKIEEKTVLLDEAQSENELGKVTVSGADASSLTSNSYGIGGMHRVLLLSTYSSPVSLIYYPKLKPGEYEVFANKPRVVSNSNADMTASVTHANGTSPAEYNIRSGGDVQLDENWVSLGVYEFSGSYGRDNVEIKTATTHLGQAKNARFDAVKFVAVQNDIVDAFNNANTFDKMVTFFKNYESDIDIHIDTLDLIYRDAIYKKLANQNTDTYTDMCNIINNTIQSEESNPTLRIFNGANEITSLESGELSAKVSTDLIEPGCSVIVAIYSDEGNLLAAGLKNYSEQAAEIDLNLGNVTVQSSNPTIKLLVWENMGNMHPIDIYR